MAEHYMIDPPSGWKYGFPKAWKGQDIKTLDVKKWLIENGYPEEEINSLGGDFQYRVWVEKIQNKNVN